LVELLKEDLVSLEKYFLSSLNKCSVQYLILDECDDLLGKGFDQDVRKSDTHFSD
jgi:superfamily II DNA/RNA helicase